MGTTYLVYNLQVNKLAVLKEIKAYQSSKARELFAREARVLQDLRHPSIPRFYDFFCDEEHYSLVMEMIHGPTLEQVRPKTPAQAVGWIVETLEVLSHLHQQGVLHRDIKPANLILRYHPRQIVLIDYGAVKEASAPRLARSLSMRLSLWPFKFRTLRMARELDQRVHGGSRGSPSCDKRRIPADDLTS